jgi:radical SAM superfamily enzyme YgiQ (UPF0313 family)
VDSPGEILVVSCYEMGRQPVALAAALAALEQAGFRPAALDVSVEKLDPAALRRARLVAVSVPMHTALRLGVLVAARARELNPAAHIAFFGLYATLNAEHLLARHGDSVIESSEALVELARALSEGRAPRPTVARPREAPLPSRAALPSLERYARLEVCEGGPRLVAFVEASRGCKHLCRHCPIVPVYRGRFFAVPRENVLADVEQQIARGAEHVSFADPDFLNGPTHALKIARELNARWPAMTFDATIKIEHLLQHRELLPELAKCGLMFITSAVESLSDRVLGALHKGHSAADVPLALQLVRDAGIELRPTLLPYTPWTELRDLPELFEFAGDHDLAFAIDPVQYTLRLLIPPGSAILDGDEPRPWLRSFEPEAFGWSWTHEDPRVDALWRQSAALMQERAGAEAGETFAALHDLAARAAQRPRPEMRAARRKTPRLTEPWFC